MLLRRKVRLPRYKEGALNNQLFLQDWVLTKNALSPTNDNSFHFCPARHERTDWLQTLRNTQRLYRGAAALHERSLPAHDWGETSTTWRFLSILSMVRVGVSPSSPLFMKNGRPDRSYFTPDCFHLSQKAHTQMARALWNNMVGSPDRCRGPTFCYFPPS